MHYIRLVVLGDSQVGKTSLIRQLVGEELKFEPEVESSGRLAERRRQLKAGWLSRLDEHEGRLAEAIETNRLASLLASQMELQQLLLQQQRNKTRRIIQEVEKRRERLDGAASGSPSKASQPGQPKILVSRDNQAAKDNKAKETTCARLESNGDKLSSQQQPPAGSTSTPATSAVATTTATTTTIRPNEPARAKVANANHVPGRPDEPKHQQHEEQQQQQSGKARVPSAKGNNSHQYGPSTGGHEEPTKQKRGQQTPLIRRTSGGDFINTGRHSNNVHVEAALGENKSTPGQMAVKQMRSLDVNQGPLSSPAKQLNQSSAFNDSTPGASGAHLGAPAASTGQPQQETSGSSESSSTKRQQTCLSGTQNCNSTTTTTTSTSGSSSEQLSKQAKIINILFTHKQQQDNQTTNSSSPTSQPGKPMLMPALLRQYQRRLSNFHQAAGSQQHSSHSIKSKRSSDTSTAAVVAASGALQDGRAAASLEWARLEEQRRRAELAAEAARAAASLATQAASAAQALLWSRSPLCRPPGECGDKLARAPFAATSELLLPPNNLYALTEDYRRRLLQETSSSFSSNQQQQQPAGLGANNANTEIRHFCANYINNMNLYEINIVDMPTIEPVNFPTSSLLEWSQFKGRSHLLTADAYLLVFDLTRPSTIQYIKMLRDKIFESREMSSVPVYVIANKADLCPTLQPSLQARQMRNVAAVRRHQQQAQQLSAADSALDQTGQPLEAGQPSTIGRRFRHGANNGGWLKAASFRAPTAAQSANPLHHHHQHLQRRKGSIPAAAAHQLLSAYKFHRMRLGSSGPVLSLRRWGKLRRAIVNEPFTPGQPAGHAQWAQFERNRMHYSLIVGAAGATGEPNQWSSSRLAAVLRRFRACLNGGWRIISFKRRRRANVLRRKRDRTESALIRGARHRRKSMMLSLGSTLSAVSTSETGQLGKKGAHRKRNNKRRQKKRKKKKTRTTRDNNQAANQSGWFSSLRRTRNVEGLQTGELDDAIKANRLTSLARKMGLKRKRSAQLSDSGGSVASKQGSSSFIVTEKHKRKQRQAGEEEPREASDQQPAIVVDEPKEEPQDNPGGRLVAVSPATPVMLANKRAVAEPVCGSMSSPASRQTFYELFNRLLQSSSTLAAKTHLKQLGPGEDRTDAEVAPNASSQQDQQTNKSTAGQKRRNSSQLQQQPLPLLQVYSEEPDAPAEGKKGKRRKSSSTGAALWQTLSSYALSRARSSISGGDGGRKSSTSMGANQTGSGRPSIASKQDVPSVAGGDSASRRGTQTTLLAGDGLRLGTDQYLSVDMLRKLSLISSNSQISGATLEISEEDEGRVLEGAEVGDVDHERAKSAPGQGDQATGGVGSTLRRASRGWLLAKVSPLRQPGGSNAEATCSSDADQASDTRAFSAGASTSGKRGSTKRLWYRGVVKKILFHSNKQSLKSIVTAMELQKKADQAEKELEHEQQQQVVVSGQEQEVETKPADQEPQPSTSTESPPKQQPPGGQQHLKRQSLTVVQSAPSIRIIASGSSLSLLSENQVSTNGNLSNEKLSKSSGDDSNQPKEIELQLQLKSTTNDSTSSTSMQNNNQEEEDDNLSIASSLSESISLSLATGTTARNTTVTEAQEMQARNGDEESPVGEGSRLEICRTAATGSTSRESTMTNEDEEANNSDEQEEEDEQNNGNNDDDLDEDDEEEDDDESSRFAGLMELPQVNCQLRKLSADDCLIINRHRRQSLAALQLERDQISANKQPGKAADNADQSGSGVQGNESSNNNKSQVGTEKDKTNDDDQQEKQKPPATGEEGRRQSIKASIEAAIHLLVPRAKARSASITLGASDCEQRSRSQLGTTIMGAVNVHKTWRDWRQLLGRKKSASGQGGRGPDSAVQVAGLAGGGGIGGGSSLGQATDLNGGRLLFSSPLLMGYNATGATGVGASASAGRASGVAAPIVGFLSSHVAYSKLTSEQQREAAINFDQLMRINQLTLSAANVVMLAASQPKPAANLSPRRPVREATEATGAVGGAEGVAEELLAAVRPDDSDKTGTKSKEKKNKKKKSSGSSGHGRGGTGGGSRDTKEAAEGLVEASTGATRANLLLLARSSSKRRGRKVREANDQHMADVMTAEFGAAAASAMANCCPPTADERRKCSGQERGATMAATAAAAAAASPSMINNNPSQQVASTASTGSTAPPVPANQAGLPVEAAAAAVAAAQSLSDGDMSAQIANAAASALERQKRRGERLSMLLEPCYDKKQAGAEYPLFVSHDLNPILKDLAQLVRKHWKCNYIECSAASNWNIRPIISELTRALECNQKCARSELADHLGAAAGHRLASEAVARPDSDFGLDLGGSDQDEMSDDEDDSCEEEEDDDEEEEDEYNDDEDEDYDELGDDDESLAESRRDSQEGRVETRKRRLGPRGATRDDAAHANAGCSIM